MHEGGELRPSSEEVEDGEGTLVRDNVRGVAVVDEDV